ncbi:DNA-processing protein DprA [Leptothrix discophora]|uniref:DNA-processing protein DprA n=1 Tax=Leptothrix discophora TaxID=89 RepID=A0ABT9G820_LEPDI|nr:DNA-processing protein DprA [Leptothrix discophora]MDP4302328.1 DNA-processing protein DprA [Leptothrix discophora]
MTQTCDLPKPARPSHDEVADWLHLLGTPGIGRTAARRLLATFGSPAAVREARVEALAVIVGPAAARALQSSPDGHEARVASTWDWLHAAPHRHLLTLDQPAFYPRGWLDSADPPLLIHAEGDLSLLQRPALAIVGTRHPTPDGLTHAHDFAAAAGQAGLTVVSGLAIGIDGAAHEGGLRSPGRTIAILGSGLDRIYPRSHLDLARRIAQAGLLLSEMPLGTAPLPQHFPQRNRLIATLAMGTLVVEAAVRSGSLLTARLAVEAGREVFAIPGSVHNPQSRGCHALIRQGAKLVESLQDVLEELHLAAPAGRSGAASGDDPTAVDAPDESTPQDGDAMSEDPLLAALGWSPATLDVLQARTGWSASLLSVRLLELELSGDVLRLPGGVFQRRASA